jgi:hypothetical protein
MTAQYRTERDRSVEDSPLRFRRQRKRAVRQHLIQLVADPTQVSRSHFGWRLPGIVVATTPFAVTNAPNKCIRSISSELARQPDGVFQLFVEQNSVTEAGRMGSGLA